MTLSTRLFPIVAVGVFLCAASAADAVELPAAFNGKDLSGWRVPADNKWWTVADGELVAANDPKLAGSMLWTEKDYKNFIVELDFNFKGGTIDSGVHLRHAREQIQIGISGSLKRDMTASPYIDGKGYPVEADGVAKLLKEDDWNTLTIVAMGPRYTVWLNGKRVLDYESETAEARGPIGLQIHPNTDMRINFRKIGIAELR